MSTVQIRALAVCAWLLAIVFALPALAAYEDYTLYRDGKHVTATVLESSVRGDHVAATLQYPTKSEPREWKVYTTGEPERFAKGARVAVLLHANNGQPILADDLSKELPSPWLPVAMILSIAGGVALWRLPTRAAVRRAARTHPLDAIVDAARRTRNLSLGLGLGLAAAAVLFAVIPLLDREGGVAAVIVIEGLAAATAWFALVLLRRCWRFRDPRRSELLVLVEERPQDIAWCYVHRIVVRGMETLAAHVWKSDGKMLNVALVAEDADAVMAELARRAPHARHGFDRETERLYREQPARWRPAAVALIALVALAAGCGSSEPSWLKEMRPHMQGALDDHGKRLAPALRLIPPIAALTPLACERPAKAPADGKVPSLGRDLADRLARGGVETLSVKWHHGEPLTGASYSALLGDTGLISQGVFEPAMKELTDTPLVGVYVTKQLDRGKITSTSIERPATFDGWFVLVELSPPRVIARVPITAKSNDFVMISNDEPADVQLVESLEYTVHEATAKALAPGCAGLAPD